MGDLSGKFGVWTDMTTVISIYNDSNLQIFGYNSVLGRSFVIHKKNPARRYSV